MDVAWVRGMHPRPDSRNMELERAEGKDSAKARARWFSTSRQAVLSLSGVGNRNSDKSSTIWQTLFRDPSFKLLRLRKLYLPLRVVQIEGLAILKIIKHCKEFSPVLVTGQLLGLDVGSVLEITNCFPFPVREDDEEVEAEHYQLEMMRCLREVNVDNNTVGWYQSTLFGSFQTVELIETFMNYQETIRRCVCIIYDPSRSNEGVLALKALKLSDSFMSLHRSNNFTGEKLREKNLTWLDVFEEIPINVSNSALVSAFMTELEADSPVSQCDFDRLQLSSNPLMERNLEFLIECMDEMSIEQQKLQFYYRNLSRQQAQQQAWLQKRRAENMARKTAGEEPLADEDPSNPIFKPIPEPSRLDTYLITNQAANYCNQINGIAGRSFNKLYLMKALQDK